MQARVRSREDGSIAGDEGVEPLVFFKLIRVLAVEGGKEVWI